ncbi:ATP-binding cassette domain-containing protein [Verrucomicrobiota bacterium sgz303538]
MLEFHDLSLQLGDGPDAPLLLSELNASLPTKGHFAAILGPSGCGKSTLLKVIAGLREPTMGRICWEGRDLVEEGDLAPHEIGYVPQFSIAYDLLTVWESVDDALRLRVSGLSADEAEARIEQILRDVGLEEIADRRVQVLSGGQKRRLALALEMVSAPRLLLCDEVTSGLDPKAEDEIAHLLHKLSRGSDRLVLSVTHSLRHLSLCDSVIVLYQGHIAYHGSPDHLFHYFGVEKHEDLFPRLAKRKPEEWHRSWIKHRDAYYIQSGLDPASASGYPPVAAAVTETPAQQLLGDNWKDKAPKTPETQHSGANSDSSVLESDRTPEVKAKADAQSVLTPSFFTQFGIIFGRRWKLFLRDRGQLLLQLALLFGFPCLVVIFALDGLPQLKSLAEVPGGSFLQQLQSDFAQRGEMIRTGSLVSGLVMFQVILLALMGANNGAREVASERLIFEKEKFAGLSPTAYVFAKASFLGVLVLAQSIWMGLFVNWIVRFPGSLGAQLLLLTLVNGALTAVCLGISSWMRTAEQASLVSVYLVGFQLPLSGAVLAMPAALNAVTRWFIASYWGWSGYLQTLHDTRFYNAVQQVTHTRLSEMQLCIWVLICHVFLGIYLATAGCRNPRWE